MFASNGLGQAKGKEAAAGELIFPCVTTQGGMRIDTYIYIHIQGYYTDTVHIPTQSKADLNPEVDLIVN